MKKVLLVVLAVLSLSVFSAIASAACPNLAGNYTVVSASGPNGPEPVPAGVVMHITQKECQEVDVVQTNGSQGESPLKFHYIVDGQPHPWADIGDVGVHFTVACNFKDNAMVGALGMTSIPGQVVGTIEYVLDATGKTLTFSMKGQGFNMTQVAVRK